MQVTETCQRRPQARIQGRGPGGRLGAKVDARLDELKDQVRINGFRPGKVPVAHLKRLYGRSVMAEVIEATVREANAKIVTERRLQARRASRRSRCRTEKDEVEQVIEGKSDLAYTVAIEILPPIELADFKDIKLERLIAEVDRRRGRRGAASASPSRTGRSRREGEGAKAENGDRVTIDFAGTIDGEPFEGGTGEDVAV